MRLKNQSVAFGNPVQFNSDRGAAFTSEDFRKYCEEENIRHHLITTDLQVLTTLRNGIGMLMMSSELLIERTQEV